MNDYSMPTYFQNMPVLNAPAYKPNPENVAELKKIEEEIKDKWGVRRSKKHKK